MFFSWCPSCSLTPTPVASLLGATGVCPDCQTPLAQMERPEPAAPTAVRRFAPSQASLISAERGGS